MKIAMIGQKGMPASYGGVERHVHDLATHLAIAGHDVTVYSRKWYTKGRDGIIDGVLVKHLPSLKTKHLDTITHTFFATLHAIFGGFDIIHYHGVGPALLAWLPRLLAPKTKVIITFHSIDRYHQKWGRFAQWILRLGEKAACTFGHETITVSQSLANYCYNEFRKETRQIVSGLNQTNTLPDATQLKQFGVTPNQYILMVSRLIPHKGAHLLVEAFAKLKQIQADDPEIRRLKLIIVGGEVYTSNYVSALHEQAAACNDIIFTDWQSGAALSTLYYHAMALVHPSLSEGLPITVLEAMNYGRPVLLSNIPEHLELVYDPRAIFNQNDINDLIAKLSDFLRLGSVERREMGEHNKRAIEDRYRWGIIVPQILELYAAKKSTNKANVATAIA